MASILYAVFLDLHCTQERRLPEAKCLKPVLWRLKMHLPPVSINLPVANGDSYFWSLVVCSKMSLYIYLLLSF
jgi:hypothetical protein